MGVLYISVAMIVIVYLGYLLISGGVHNLFSYSNQQESASIPHFLAYLLSVDIGTSLWDACIAEF